MIPVIKKNTVSVYTVYLYHSKNLSTEIHKKKHRCKLDREYERKERVIIFDDILMILWVPVFFNVSIL